MRVFLAIARSGTIVSAASALGVNTSTVTRRINAFETTLNVRLFDRSPAGYTVTPTGEQLRLDAERIECDILATRRRVAGADKSLRGPVVFSAARGLSGTLLLPYLPEFSHAYPGIEIEIREDDALLDLNRQEADVVLRATNSAPDHLVGRRLGTGEMHAYCSPAYLARDLERPWLIVEESADRPLPEWSRQLGDARVTLRSSSREVRVNAAQSGLGITLLPAVLGDLNRALVRAPLDIPQQPVELWLLTHPDLRRTERIRVFQEFMVSVIERIAEKHQIVVAETEQESRPVPGFYPRTGRHHGGGTRSP